jgi:hypothetical protein
MACLALLMASLAGCAGGNETDNSGTSTPTQTVPTPTPRTISGTVSFTGAAKPAHQIIVVAGRAGEQSPAYSAVIKELGPYTISNVTDASYTLFAFVDLGDDMGAPQADEPSGAYDLDGNGQADPVTMKDGKGLTDIDINLHEPG